MVLACEVGGVSMNGQVPVRWGLGALVWKTPYADHGRPAKFVTWSGARLLPLFPVSLRKIPPDRGWNGHASHNPSTGG